MEELNVSKTLDGYAKLLTIVDSNPGIPVRAAARMIGMGRQRAGVLIEMAVASGLVDVKIYVRAYQCYPTTRLCDEVVNIRRRNLSKV